ncbi:MAG: hypothetical protein JJU05_11015 [Verrucomicrobia bacterium]|nr:hypothetical protein [Verrucomicrobiota bacterium]MCH8527375.1 hypothetical protein [Kiritimatiellia bacterium]
MRSSIQMRVYPFSLFVVAAAGFAGAENILRQHLGNGDLLVIESRDPVPDVVIQETPRFRPYPDNLMETGLHFRTGSEIDVPMDIRMVNLNTSHVIGAHGEGTVVRYRGRWQADGGNALPHLVLTEGARFVFTEESSMNLVMEGSYFTRQLWVWGDGTGVLELEEGFVADSTRKDPLPEAMGTIRLGGATLITHHTRNLPANTRPDGRGGHYQNGHIVFERIPGNRWIVDSTNQMYGAQLDFATDAVVETRASLTHVGHRRVVLPVGPGGPFRSSGAFRTTSPDVTITKTGPGMLALEGEQSYHPGSRLVVEEGLLRMATDPGLGRDPDARGNAGVSLQMEVKNDAGAHFIGPLHRLRSLSLEDQAEMWVDDHLVLEVTEGISAGPETALTVAGDVHGPLRAAGMLTISGTPRFAALHHAGELYAGFGQDAPDNPALYASESLTLEGTPRIRFQDRRGRVPDAVLFAESPQMTLSEAFSGEGRCLDDTFQFDWAREGNQLWMRNIRALED